MVEDYRIHFHIGYAQLRAPGSSREYMDKKKKRYEYVHLYKTDVGEFTPEEWREKIFREIVKEGKTELLERIKQHCRERCAWLYTELEIEEYAMDCLASRAYEKWDDFQDTETIIWM